MSEVSIRSLMPTGTPCRGPCVGLRSRARAWARAASGARYSQARTLSSRAVIRSRQALTSASLVIVPAAIACAASTLVSSCRGFIRLSTLQQHCRPCSLTICTASEPNAFPRAKLGTAYRNWPRQFGGATSRAQHRGAALGGRWRGRGNQPCLFQLRPQGGGNRKFDHPDVVLNLCH